MPDGGTASYNGDNSKIQEGAFLSFISTKCEKISSALYLVTNFFPEDEPLRVSIRQKTLFLLSIPFSMQRKTNQLASDVSLNISPQIYELVALLRVARDARLITDMNYGILEGELKHLASYTETDTQTLTGPRLSGTFFEIGDGELSKSLPVQKRPQQSGVERKSAASRQHMPQNSTRTQKSASESATPTKTRRRSKRRDSLLDLVKERGEISIKDAVKVVQGCSQKTIQRELTGLVDEGVLEKKGKRRWTTYTLA